MAISRVIFGLLMLACVVCFAMYVASGQAVWRRRGMVILAWTLAAALLFFAVLAVQRLIPLL